MPIVNLDQNGPDWHRWRQGGIGGSDACVINRDVNWTTRDELQEIKRGRFTVQENERMARGKRLEPVARARYQDETGIRVRPVCVQHPEYTWMRASLDGLSEDGQIVLEIKCPFGERPKGHDLALKGQVPRYYRAQFQHQLCCVWGWTPETPEGRGEKPILHFYSFTDSEAYPEHERGVKIPVEADPDFMESLIMKEKRFINELNGG